jgi:acyl-CoA synthetase (NDP forming)
MDFARRIKDVSGVRKILTEAESKAVLRQYGVPVVDEWVVRTADEAVRQADKLGYPVVLKGLGEKLAHKTELGLVRLNLRSAEELRAAAGEITGRAGADLEGLLLQPMVTGRREFVAGLFRDFQFGPVVMFGLGGILTEALDDTIFRLAPLDEAEALHMIGQLRSKKLLASFRGDKPVDREALVRTLVGLSRLGCDHPEIREVDVNPLIVSADGRVTAVDALVILEKENRETRSSAPLAPVELFETFSPRSVALIGATGNFRKWGFRIFTGIAAGKYEGRLYLVNPKGGAIAGRPVYRSLDEIGEPVDLAVVTVPAEGVIDLIPSMQAKGIKKMLLISSGFSETGAGGRNLERDLVAAAERAGVLILGPNTMGLINPHGKFYSIGTHAHPIPGSISYISQSGNLGSQLLGAAVREGIGIRCFVGSGNEAMVTIEDYLDGCAADALTRTIVMYIESIKDGRRFFESARRVGRQKPVIVLKGGRTQEGNKAAASHTGGMASDKRVFDAACEQAGIVVVDQPTELFNIAASLSFLPVPRGKRVAIVSMGGGWGVAATDLCVEHGLEIPPLTPEIIATIDQFLPSYWSRSNPVDLVGDTNPAGHLKIMEEFMKWDGCDACIHLGIIGSPLLLQHQYESASLADRTGDWSVFETFISTAQSSEREYLTRLIALMERYQKPILGAYRHDEGVKTILDLAPGSPYKTIVFRTAEQVIHAMSKLCVYGQWVSRIGSGEKRDRTNR